MKNKFYIVSGCLLLVVATQFRFSIAEEAVVVDGTKTTVSSVVNENNEKNEAALEREKTFKKSFEDKMKAYKQLKVGKNETIYKLTDLVKNPKPLPNILEMINTEQDVKSFKMEFEKIWPKFWKVSERKQCAKLFDEKTENLIKEITEEMKDDYDKALASLLSFIRDDDKGIEEEQDKLIGKYQDSLSSCKMYDLRCDIFTIKMEYGFKNIEYVEGVLKKLDSLIVYSVKEALYKKLQSYLINPVRECLNKVN